MTELPALIYDGDCGFCTRSVRLADRLPVRVSSVPWQEANLEWLGVPEQRARNEVVFVDEYHRLHGGAAAVATLLRHCRGPWRLAGSVLAAPVIRSVADAVYRLVANNRHRLPGETPACQLPPERRPGKAERDSGR
ncbi:putative DCC family thiol-disulfide oxidoreductase YuxK [Actinopolyspora lacussalsi]|nr:putative DCC family thiol-disulfide oxidoreductase YuxK [Actinopolyspora lacussalsi]